MEYNYFINVVSLVLVIVPVLVTFISLRMACRVRWDILFRDLGVPIGLYGSVFLSTRMVLNVQDSKAIGPATAIMLLTITYGGLISALGYFSTFKRSKPSSQTNQQTASWKAITLILSAFLGLILWAMASAAGLAPFINPVALSVFGTTIIAAILLSDSDHRVEVLCQASLLSAMISLVFGLIVLYRSFSGDGINEGMYEGLKIAMNGLSYGLLSYICIYIVSYKFGTTERIDAPLMNWHWLEVTGFLIFMFFAPETLRESLLH
jgi:hypothetical protein